ncbi:MAG: hypothetical protein RLZZ344_822 [Pseudomonadota bacterium]
MWVLLRFGATVFGQMLNVILLLVNMVALLVALGERASVEPGGMQWLASVDWAQLGGQFWRITQDPEISSMTIMAVWLSLSILWASATAIDFFMHQRRAARTAAELGRAQDLEDASLPTNESYASGQGLGSPALAQGAPAGRSGISAQASGFAGAMASAQAAQENQAIDAGAIRTSQLADPVLGPLLNDLERQVSGLPAEAQQEIDQLRRALEALVAKT